MGPTPVDLSAYDGLSFRVRGSPQRFKINIKTVNVQDQPERVYQAVFDVAEGQWTEVRLPWRAFVPVRKNRTDPDLPALDPSAVVSVGLVYSRFAFNSFPSDRREHGGVSMSGRWLMCWLTTVGSPLLVSTDLWAWL